MLTRPSLGHIVAKLAVMDTSYAVTDNMHLVVELDMAVGSAMGAHMPAAWNCRLAKPMFTAATIYYLSE